MLDDTERNSQDVPVFTTAAQDARLIELGYQITVCEGKASIADAWQAGEVTAERIAQERAEHPAARNTGARCGNGLVADDIDLSDANEIRAMQYVGDKHLGKSFDVRIGSKGRMTFYRTDDATFGKIMIHEPIVTDSKPTVRTLVEIFGRGQVLLYGKHPNGVDYTWPNADAEIGGYHPLIRPVASLASTTLKACRACMAERLTWLKANGHPNAYLSGDVDDREWKAKRAADTPIYEADFVVMLGHVECNSDRDSWVSRLASLRSSPVIRRDGTELSTEDLFEHALQWCRGEYDHAGRYKDAPPATFSTSATSNSITGEPAVRAAFYSLKAARSGMNDRTIASLIEEAKRNGYTGPTSIHNAPPEHRPAEEVFSAYLDANDIEGEGEQRAAEPVDLWAETAMLGEPVLTEDMLPPVIGAMAADIAKRHGVSIDLPTASCITAFSNALHNDIRLQGGNDTRFLPPAKLWNLVIVPPGGHKTDTMAEAYRPLIDMEKLWDQQDGIAIRQAERIKKETPKGKAEKYPEAKVHAILLGLNATAKKPATTESVARGFLLYPMGYTKTIMKELMAAPVALVFCTNDKWFIPDDYVAPEDIPTGPVDPDDVPRRQLLVFDTTMERLAVAARDNQRLGFYSDEVKGVLERLNAYRPHGVGGDVQAFLKGKDGSPHRQQRVKGDVYVPCWAFSIIATVQPDVIVPMAPDMAANGLLQRFQIWRGERIADESDTVADPAVTKAYNDALLRVINLAPKKPNRSLVFSEAAHAWRLRMKAIVGSIEFGLSLPSQLVEYGSKLMGDYVRTVCVFHVALCMAKPESTLDPEISEEAAHLAFRLYRNYLIPSAIGFYVERFGYTKGDGGNFVRKVASWILRRQPPVMTRREVMHGPLKGQDANAVDTTMGELWRAGWVTREVVKSDHGGPDQVRYRMDPRLFDKLFAERRDIELRRYDGFARRREFAAEKARRAKEAAKYK